MNLPFGFLIETDFNGDGLLFLALLVLGIIFIFLMNKPWKHGQGRLDHWMNWIIPLVRSVALLILLLLLFAPQISVYRQYSIPKHLAVVIDQSRSMGNAWEGDIEELQQSISNIVEVLAINHSVDVWTMGGQETTPGNLTFDDSLSVFEWSPLTSNGQNDEDIYSAVFLFSDGHLNGGRSPLDLGWSKSLEVNVVYPLKPKLNASLELIDVSYQTNVGNTGEILIQGKLQQEGLLGRHATVQILTEMDQILGEKTFQISQSFQDIDLPIRLVNDKKMRVKVKLVLEGGEFLTEQFLEIHQDTQKKSVLIVSERINDLHNFLIQSFSDSSYQIYVIQGTRRGGVRTDATIIPDKLDLIVLNSPGERVYKEITQSAFDLKAHAKTPTVLFYKGIESMYPQWVELLGGKVVQANDIVTSQTSFWSESAKEHAFYLGLLGRSYKPSDLMDYAPITVPAYRLITKGEDLLITGVGSLENPALSLSNQPPRAIFSGSGFWRWFFHPQAKSSFNKFWNYLLTYLTEISSFNPVRIELAEQSATTGSYIIADVAIKDLDNRNINAAELRVWQEDEMGEKKSLNLTRNQDGIYQTQLDTKRPGEQLIIAEAYRFGELWGRDTSRIHLMSFNGEDQSRGVDEVFLTRLAARGGGQVIQYQEDDLPIIPVETIKRESAFHFRGIRSPLLFAILLLLLTFEWIWRRRSGLL